MGDFLLIVVAALVVAGIGFGIAAFVLGRDPGLAPPRPDAPPYDLPDGRPLNEADLRDLRLDTALRGYRMDQVDDLLRRVEYDLGELWAHVERLEAARGPSADDPVDAAPPGSAEPPDAATALGDGSVADPFVPAGGRAEDGESRTPPA